MPETTKTATEIVAGALELIQQHDYTPFGHTDTEYSIPAAFDKVAFDDPNHTSDLIVISMALQDQGAIFEYPHAYCEAKKALDMSDLPRTKEQAIDILTAGLENLSTTEGAAA